MKFSLLLILLLAGCHAHHRQWHFTDEEMNDMRHSVRTNASGTIIFKVGPLDDN